MIRISPLTQQEWPWLLSRSIETGWAQLPPLLQAQSTREVTSVHVQQMLRMALAQQGAAALVARDEGTPVGYIVVSIAPDELTGGPVGLFVDIWVEEPWRGKGVSSKLTAAGEEHLRSLGLKIVRRFIAAHNEKSLRHARGDGTTLERLSYLKPL